MTHQVHRPAASLRTALFPTAPRETTSKILVSYTNQVPDVRIDAQAVDMADASRAYFGCIYHYVIGTSGRIEVGRDPRTCSPKTRQKRFHKQALFIGVVGGLSADTGRRISTITDAQNEAVEWLMQALADTLGVELEVIDHTEHWAASRDLQSKDLGKAVRSEILEAIYAEMTDEELAASPDRLAA